MRCPRCGNENPGENRFCGMCGTTLLAPPPVAETQTERAASAGPALPPLVPPPATPRAPAAEPPRTVAPVPVEPPRPAIPSPALEPPVITRTEERPAESVSISGPSFLGLNDPPPRKRASLSIDPHGAHDSRNLDYLLDEGDEPKRGGGGKFLLILIALALAVGFGYLRWKNQGLSWLTTGPKKPTAAAQDAGNGDTSAPPAAAPSSSPDGSSGAASQPPANTPPAAASTPADSSATAPAATSGATPANAAPSTTPAASDTAASDTAKSPPKSDSENPPAATTKKSPAPDAEADDSDKPSADPDEPAPKPRPAPKPIDKVAEAQKYLYGRGVAQDCDRGLRLLKPAANQSDPKAMIEMGALYSAGLCTPRDLPTAYRWFALSLRKDPSNQSVQTDLQKLWGEMTQPERQLAIKLTQ